jgi:hypothetical protein
MEKLFTDQRQLVMARYPSLAADHLAQSANAERTGYLYKQGSAIAHSLALVVGDTPTSPDRLVVCGVGRWTRSPTVAKALVCSGRRFPLLLLFFFRT